MKSDAIAAGIAGIAFGLIAGWIIGSQQAGGAAPPAVAPATQAAAPSGPPPVALDEAKLNEFKAVAQREPANAAARVQIANLYFDAERYQDAITWYTEALKLSPRDVNVSTDLGVSFYYTNQADRALAQFADSLKIDPRHAKTLLNVGVVRAFGKQDLTGAEQAWKQVVEFAPDSPEAQAAKRALDSLKSAHPGSASPAPQSGG
jgi:tetratricopeptide (TPR) repeat protein